MPRRLPDLAKREDLQFYKNLSVENMLKIVRNNFLELKARQRVKLQFNLPDVLISDLAIFMFKYPLLLQFNKKRNAPRIKHNLRKLFGVFKALCEKPAMKKSIHPSLPVTVHV